MNHLSNSLCKFLSLQAKRNVLLSSKIFVRNSSVTTWNKDWQPGPYPRTEEQRIAAAKKYNLLPEDYEPYPEEEGYGDYPKFAAVHMADKSDFAIYDYPHLKRNFGEPLHPDTDMLIEDKINKWDKKKWPIWQQFLFVGGIALAYTCLIYWDQEHLPDKRRIPKQYPFSGQTYYTFEPAE